MSREEQVIRLVSPNGIEEEKAVQIAISFANKLHLSSYVIKQDKDPSLLAGFVVYVGGYRYDYSAKGHIQALGQQLKENQEEVFDLKTDMANSLSITKDYNNLDLANLWDVEPVALDDNDISLSLLMDQFHNQIHSKVDSKLIDEVGEVISVSDGIAYVSGLDHCINNELLIFSNTTFGIAMNLEPNRVGVILLGDLKGAKQGSYCKRSGRTVSVPTGLPMLGRVVDALGCPIDGKGKIAGTVLRPIEQESASVIDRQSVCQPLYTGITAIDSMTPIGRGQRELIIGDRQTGKTTIAIDTILNQKGKDIACIYVAIGQKMSTVAQLVNTLEKNGALEYTTVVVASAADTAAMQYIAPYAGCTMAEELMYNEKKDVLIVYDDLTKHAQAYRAISLLLRRPPGREAFPGDVFYLHSRLLERSARLSDELGGHSITALPIVETQAGDISAYVPTNVISITDGQIYLETGLFFSGQRPAINVGLSVSRVGGAAQEKIMKKVAGPLRLNLAQYRELQAFSQFGSDLDQSTQDVLRKGERLAEVLKQSPQEPRSMPIQVVLLYLATRAYFDNLAVYDVRPFCDYFIDHLKSVHTPLLEKIQAAKEIQADLDEEIVQLFDNYLEQWKQEQANATAF